MQILTDQQAEYVRQRIAGKTQRDAYALAYPKSRFWKPATRDSAACRLEARPYVRAVMDAARRQRLERAIDEGIVDRIDVMRELACVGFSDATDYVQIEERESHVNEAGEAVTYPAVTLTPTSELTRNQRAAIAGIRQTRDGMIEVKLHSKTQALKLLGDALGMFDKAEDSGEVEDLKPLAELLNGDEKDAND